eukprot:3361010-Rhodomonas_salina.5
MFRSTIAHTLRSTIATCSLSGLLCSLQPYAISVPDTAYGARRQIAPHTPPTFPSSRMTLDSDKRASPVPPYRISVLHYA